MKLTNISFAGVMFGLFVACSAGIRYFVLWPDPDKGIFFGLIGLIIIAVAWNYAGRVELQHEIEKLQYTLTDVEQYIVDKDKENEN